jgi:hypothetical protein
MTSRGVVPGLMSKSMGSPPVARTTVIFFILCYVFCLFVPAGHASIDCSPGAQAPVCLAKLGPQDFHAVLIFLSSMFLAEFIVNFS